MTLATHALLGRLRRAGLAPARWIAATAIALGFTAAPHASAATFKIEIDYMVSAGHSHKPSQEVLDAVVQMFACQGHTLILEVSTAITHYNTIIRDPGDCAGSLFSYSGAPNSFGALKAMFANHSESDGWHYCIFAHQYEDTNCVASGSSGLGERPGWNFIVTLGSFSGQTGTLFDQASTLAHEFGHNLGLTHCGTMECGDTTDPAYVGPFAPNLASTMSYRYQLAGLHNNMLFNHLTPPEALFKEIDYSHGTLCSLNENNLNETLGTYMTTTDWNCNGILSSGVVKDIRGGNSGWCSANTAKHVLSDYDEWSAISDPGFNFDGSRIPREEISCITADEWAETQNNLAFGGFVQPTLTVESCLPGRNIFVGPGALPFGTCSLPYPTVALAQISAPNYSVYFLRPGTFNESGVLTLNKPGTYLANVGAATIK